MNFIRRIQAVLCGNSINLLISVFMVIALPKYLTMEDYGYWQLFLFYFSYIGLFHLGWEDGIYLKYVGCRYDDLNKKYFNNQLMGVMIFELIISTMIVLILSRHISNDSYRLVLIYIAVMNVIYHYNGFCSYVFQISSRFYDYSKLIIIEPVVFCITTLFLLITNKCVFENLLTAKLLSMIMVFVFVNYRLTDMVHPQKIELVNLFHDAIDNIKVGINLMIANVAGMLVIGVIRYAISNTWDIIVFGKISLSLSLSNFLFFFINAVSIVLLPSLKRATYNEKIKLYDNVKFLLSSFIFSIFIFYFPIYFVLIEWIPQYVDSFKYLAILFPLCIYESRNSLIINNYLKALRKERLILYSNLVSLLLSVIIAFFCTMILKDLFITLCSIVVIFFIKCFVSDRYLCSVINKAGYKQYLLDGVMSALFIFVAYNYSDFVGLAGYFLVLLIYYVLTWKRIKKSLYKVKQMSLAN